ncbi:signal transduction histidine kinase regulating citrate/malate metabolism [Nocardioides albertanoniae]|uniref:histidine kinase n=1 Tax=Nocardioides albertanoniae TaxID=1175486 RepID=A0A543A6E2_9ACTN|nr:ATP-binding protein [Nocardioides albertanoniae]TQL68056.1 signal transduction histidine kinase regulating citrate/malate metabolism [Nocardioides albertanoniae]
MWSQSSRRHLSLAGQVLLLQLTVLLLVVVATSIVSLRQSDADFRDSREDRLRAAAESLAGIAAVQDGLSRTPDRQALAFYLQNRAADAGADTAYLTGLDGRVLVSTDPTRVGETLDLGRRESSRAWAGDIDDAGRRAIAAQVPVYGGGSTGTTGSKAEAPHPVGVVVVTEDYPLIGERLARTWADALTVLLAGLALGVLGSWLLARLIKRRTRGLEPRDIAALADHREGLLRSIREGVLAVGGDGRVSLMSDSARELLGLTADPTGRRLDELDLPSETLALLSGSEEVHDAPLVAGDRVLVLNRNRVHHDGRPAGTVTTLRDRTELVALQSELNSRESVTETLRAQTHEFSNQLHTITGLLELEEYAEVGRFVVGLTARRAALSDFITARIDDPAVAALLIAKASLAAERRVSIDLEAASALPRLTPDGSADVVTVLGNLVDNAVDAAALVGPLDARVGVRLSAAGQTVTVRVSDTGGGVPADRMPEIFRRGFSTKPHDASGRGVGLALVQLVCRARGGEVEVENAGAAERPGAVFTATLPGAAPLAPPTTTLAEETR